MLLHSLQWIRHKFNEVITDPSCEFMLTVCSQSHGPSTVNSRQSFQPSLPANKPVTGSLGAATLGHRRQTSKLLGFLSVFPPIPPAAEPLHTLAGAFQAQAMLFHLPGAVASGMREAQMGSVGLVGAWVGWMAPARCVGVGIGWKWGPPASALCWDGCMGRGGSPH